MALQSYPPVDQKIQVFHIPMDPASATAGFRTTLDSAQEVVDPLQKYNFFSWDLTDPLYDSLENVFPHAELYLTATGEKVSAKIVVTAQLVSVQFADVVNGADFVIKVSAGFGSVPTP